MRKVVLIILAVGLLFASIMALATSRPVKKRVTAIYPELAKRMHVAGTVKLEVTIDAAGNVGEVKVLSGHPLLGSSRDRLPKALDI